MSKHSIKICKGGPCKNNFSEDTIKTAQKELKINIGESTKDGIELDTCGCLGNCSQGPSVMIDGEIKGHIFPKEIKQEIKKLQE